MKFLTGAGLFCLLSNVVVIAGQELLKNGGFESLSDWQCWAPLQCFLTSDAYSGSHAVVASSRAESWQGPTQYITVNPGQRYNVSAYMKLLSDHIGENMEAYVDMEDQAGHHVYQTVATHGSAKTSDGWVFIQGSFTAPHTAVKTVRVAFDCGPSAHVLFAVDEASVTPLTGITNVTDAYLNNVIDRERKGDMHFNVKTASGVHMNDIKIHVLQKKKSFPFGSSFNAHKYNEGAANGKYRDFVNKHFNWVVPENALQWYDIEWTRGHMNYKLALDAIHGVKSHGIKVRGHNLVWSVEKYVQGWIKQLSPTELKTVVKHHIEETMNMTRGLLEHWDVNNEMLHGSWYQDRAGDPNYNLELFRIAHHADPSVKLFLNDYNVVAGSGFTNDYLAQAKKYKAANVGLGGMGVQCHFAEEIMPDASLVKERLDLLSTAGVPIWVTELDVVAVDENKRADLYEAALRALYGHPAVQGILFWGFWDQTHWRGPHAALAKGNNMELTAAGRRVLDLFENQWMTDETHVLSAVGNQFNVRGFHGDYEIHVLYQGRELPHLMQNITLYKGSDVTVSINVQNVV
ncbi:uncharacterized protein [Littorina saxatilis]|uniref:GH10 domain-containing protein n=1 Tax=Littorina saxatilis TaxID=31220 RepID=A0AAN9GF54_9CAEN